MSETERLQQELRSVYASAALSPDPALCCASASTFDLPDLVVPPRCLEMNYGCGSTVSPADLQGKDPILYVGVGGGLEALQFAYFRRRPGGVVAVDPVEEMREAARINLEEAARLNPWFDPSFVSIVPGDALHLPVADGSIGVIAQNCLFNVFLDDSFEQALRESFRVLAVGGTFTSSDPIAEQPIPEALRRDTRLRARCISGCRTYEQYIAAVLAAGFGTVEVRARRPYRLLLPHEFPELLNPILLESIDLVARRTNGRPPRWVFSGRCAIYLGNSTISLGGMSFAPGLPVIVSDGFANHLADRADFRVTPPTWSVSRAGCC